MSGKAQNFRWSTLLWALVYPRKKERITLTVSGVLLIGLSFGLGSAAYNAANNILFIALSLLLACLILSGVLSWLNFRGLDWRLQISPPVRVGQEAIVTLVITNRKRRLPTYGLWFELAARQVDTRSDARPESTITARGIDVRKAFREADRVEARQRLHLYHRLDPGTEARLEWLFRPQHRGRVRVELESVGSLFPFGFLKKYISVGLAEEVVVWPAPVEYRRFATASTRQSSGEENVARAGVGTDLFALRPYQIGDSHRLIHWKASARNRELLVRQFAAETAETYSLWLRTDAADWAKPEQFELLISLAATLAEDLFRAGKLNRTALNGEPPLQIRRVRDLDGFLDALALATPVTEPASALVSRGVGRNLVTFQPDGPRGIAAYVGNDRVATA
jgi:uncharacterized protein (DUF58 family)